MKYFALMAALLVGCEKEPEPSPAKPEESLDVAIQETADVATPDAHAIDAGQAPAAFEPSRSRALEGTPHDHLDGTLTLKYEGPSGAFDLFRTAGDRSSISGKAPLQSGMEIDVRRSQVFIIKPRPVVARRDLDVIATRWDRVASRSGTDDVLHIKSGQTVNLLKSAGDGHCWLSIAGDDFKAGCPTVDDFESDRWEGQPTPVEFEWWVKTAVSGAQGWLPIDEVSFSWSVKPNKRR